ncbi:MAG: response regulator, partial [Bacteroidia bacterium]
NNYDVVLMDVHMPVMNGYEATQAIRNMQDPVKANIPIIAITAAVDNNLYDKVTTAGMNDYILKPFKINHLYGKLDTVVTSVG